MLVLALEVQLAAREQGMALFVWIWTNYMNEDMIWNL